MESDNDHGHHKKLSLKGQAKIWKYMFSFADSMALRYAVELQIPDIINSHGDPITLAQIAVDIPKASSLEIPYLARIMRLLVCRIIFAAHRPSDSSDGEALYGLTHSSRWLLRDTSDRRWGVDAESRTRHRGRRPRTLRQRQRGRGRPAAGPREGEEAKAFLDALSNRALRLARRGRG